ncbi:MAG: hypothetical protein EBR87_05595 [Cytophagia bacterium]|nr:hypothetical protein [Cytophagia bacterium]
MIPFLVKKSVKQLVCKQLFRRFFLFFLFATLTFSSKAEWQTIHSFEKEWLVFQPSWKAFLPYISTRHLNYKSKSLLINPTDFPKGHLKIEASKNYTLFINGVFSRKITQGSLLRMNLDSLGRKQPLAERLVLTFYGDELNGLPQKVFVEQNVEKGKISTLNFLGMKIREGSGINNFFAFAMLSLLTLLGFLYSFFPKYFHSYFRFSDWLSLEIKDVVIAKMPFAFPNLFVIFILSLVTAYLAYFNGLLHTLNQSFTMGSSLSEIFSEAFLFIGTKTIIALMLFGLRFFMYQMFCSLFKLDNLASIHFFKSIQTNIQFFTLLIFFILIYSVYMGPIFIKNLNWIRTAVDMYFLFRAVYFFIIFKKHFKFNPLSLIAYLAIIEGQVLLFGIRELIFPEFM